MNNMVTVAIASYNNASYIERCVDSVLQQTYSHLEILIVDDGSKDDTLERIQRYKCDDRVRVIVKENGGLSSVRQKALDEANGDYICFIDADDYLADSYVEVMLKQILADNSDICVCSTRFEAANGAVDEKKTASMACNDGVVTYSVISDEFIRKYNKISRVIHVSDSWNKMYSLSFIKNSGVTFNMPKGYNGSDTIFNRKLMLHQPRYSTISKEVYIHVLYKSSAVHRKNKDLLRSFMYITRDLIKEAEKLKIREHTITLLSNYYYSCLFRAFYDVYSDGSSNVSNDFSLLYKRHEDFIRQMSLAPLRVGKVDKSRLLFYFVFKYSRRLLPTYIKIYKSIK